MAAYNTISLTPYDNDTLRNVVEHDTLARYCPLDNGCHALELDYATAPDLGLLSQLPVELVQQVVLELDVASLLVWRRVNKRAMDSVANMIEWKKLTVLAPSTLRMAIGLRSHATFSFAELHDALHRRTCGTLDCPNTVRYINMKTLVRLCATCFYPSLWGTLGRLALTLRLAQTMRFNEHANEDMNAVKEVATPCKVRLDERIGFVEVGASERRGTGIERAKGKGINDGVLGRQWADGSAWK